MWLWMSVYVWTCAYVSVAALARWCLLSGTDGRHQADGQFSLDKIRFFDTLTELIDYYRLGAASLVFGGRLL
jgi:hypothetical protein